MKIAIYGAGGFGKEVACLIERINRNGGDWELIGFFDDSKSTDSHISRYGTVLGDMDTLLSVDEPLAVAIAINENKAVRRIRESITNALESAGQKIYNMGCRVMNGLKKGINIIRRNDGSNEKVIVK